MAEEEKRFRDYQPEGVLKDSIFDFIPDPYQMHEYLAAKRGIPSLDELDEFKRQQEQPSPELKTFIDSMELQREKIREAIREKGSPLTDEETTVIKEKYPSYSFPTGLAYGGSPEQEFVNDRIAELMMEEPVNEMRATTPDMFERQKLGIEGLLSNLYEPRRARDIAETISTGVDLTPLGDPAALAEGFRMMGDDQPLMGAALMAGSVFTNMPADKLKKLIAKAKEKLANDIPPRIYDAKNYMRQRSKGDQFRGQRMMKEVNTDKANLKKEIAEMEDALANPELPFDEAVPKQMREENLKGIVNATPEAQKLYQQILDSPSAINTPRHKKVREET